MKFVYITVICFLIVSCSSTGPKSKEEFRFMIEQQRTHGLITNEIYANKLKYLNEESSLPDKIDKPFDRKSITKKYESMSRESLFYQRIKRKNKEQLTPKNKVVTRKLSPIETMKSPMAQIRRDIISDSKLLARLRSSSNSFSGRQSGAGASITRNMIGSLYGNPYSARIRNVQNRLAFNIKMYNSLSQIGQPKRKRIYRCDDLTTKQAFQLLNNGHTYLDRDNDGIPCE